MHDTRPPAPPVLTPLIPSRVLTPCPPLRHAVLTPLIPSPFGRGETQSDRRSPSPEGRGGQGVRTPRAGQGVRTTRPFLSAVCGSVCPSPRRQRCTPPARSAACRAR